MQHLHLQRAVVIDTREQRPWRFERLAQSSDYTFDILRKGLTTGDYTLEGCESLLAIERKSLSDLAQCCGRGRRRFEAQLERLGSLPYGCVYVDGTVHSIAQESYPGKVRPATILASTQGWWLDYGVPFIWSGGPDYSARLALRLFSCLERRIVRGEIEGWQTKSRPRKVVSNS